MLLAAGCFATACSDDDNGNDTADFVGTYDMTEFNGPNAVDFDGDGDSSDNFLDESACYDNSTLRINSDGTYTMSSNGMNITNGLSTCFTTPVATSGTWERSGSVITTTQTSAGFGNGTTSSWAWSSSNETLTNAQANGQYPSYNADTGLYSWSSGSVSTVYGQR